MNLKQLDLSQFKLMEDQNTVTPAEPLVLREDDTEALADVGVLWNSSQRSGTFMVRDFNSVCSYSNVEGLEVLPIAEAQWQYPELMQEYCWQLIRPDEDQITQTVAACNPPQGFFMRVAKGMKISFPYQAALYMASADIAQAIHNVVILEEGSSLELITGCLTHQQVQRGIHFAVSEFYVGKQAVLTNTMVHHWGSEVIVRPRAATRVEDGGVFNSNYVSMRTGADIVSNPVTYLEGEGSSANFMSVILAEKGSVVNTGSKVFLNGKNSSAELKHRGVSTGGQIIQGGLMIGNAACRAHVDCSGMLLSSDPEAYIESIPGVRANSHEAQLSHEASIGKIAQDQVEYLMSRGFAEHEAISMIIRGFLDSGIGGLGEELDAAISQVAAAATNG